MRPQGSIVLVCGSRHGLPGVGEALSAYEEQHGRILHVIVGSVSGVDGDAYRWALEHERMVTVMPARWKDFGKAAGPIRNTSMAILCRPDVVLAYPGGRGTADMVAVAAVEHIPVKHWGYGGWHDEA